MRNCNPERLPEDVVTWRITYGGRGFITLVLSYMNGDTTMSSACQEITMCADGRILYVLDHQ